MQSRNIIPVVRAFNRIDWGCTRSLYRTAVLYRKDDRAMHPIWVPLMSLSLHRVGLYTLNRVFPTLPLVSPKFPHVPLGVIGWPLGYEERRCEANNYCPCN